MQKPFCSRILSFGFAALLTAMAITTTFAADKHSPVGAWKWTTQTPNGESREVKLTIKKEGEKLTGKMTGRQGQETEIQDIKMEDGGKISFTVKNERNGRTMERRFTGKIEGDAIKGETKFTNQNGEDRTREWVAKRESSTGAVDGTWASSFTRPDGNKMEYKLDLKQEGNTLTGKTISSNGNETKISDGSVKDNEVSFKIVRERDGRKFTSHYTGKIEGDSIKGKIESDWSGEKRSFDWEAKKSK